MTSEHSTPIPIKDRRRQVLVQSLGLLLMILASLAIISTLMKWSKPLISFQVVQRWPLDLIGLVALSGGYHLFCLREFGRKVILVLTWLCLALVLVVGGLALNQASDVVTGVQVFAVMGVTVLVTALLNVFLFQPATKALLHR